LDVSGAPVVDVISARREMVRQTQVMPEVRIAGDADAQEVGRVVAAGFCHDPVLTWVFREPDRTAKLTDFFAFLAREALVPLGATYVLPGIQSEPGSKGASRARIPR
jgi:hypothetical protein